MGTERNPAATCCFGPQPANFEGTLSHQVEPPGPPGIAAIAFSETTKHGFLELSLTFKTRPGRAFDLSRRGARVEKLQGCFDGVADLARACIDIAAILESSVDDRSRSCIWVR
jgi:hypothetical protein